VEKIFKATSCPEDKKLVFATYFLSREVELWWMGAQQMMEARVEVLSWESCKVRLLEKYFPDSAKFARKLNFSGWSKKRCQRMLMPLGLNT